MRGCTSWSFPVREGDRVLNVVSVCGSGVLGVLRYAEQAADRERSLRVLRSLLADIWVTNQSLEREVRGNFWALGYWLVSQYRSQRMVFGNSLVVLLVIAAPAVYGFLVSPGGRPMFGGSTGPLPGATVSG